MNDELAVMPLADYVNACDVLRAKNPSATHSIVSGQLANLISTIPANTKLAIGEIVLDINNIESFSITGMNFTPVGCFMVYVGPNDPDYPDYPIGQGYFGYTSLLSMNGTCRMSGWRNNQADVFSATNNGLINFSNGHIDITFDIYDLFNPIYLAFDYEGAMGAKYVWVAWG